MSNQIKRPHFWATLFATTLIYYRKTVETNKPEQ